MPEMISDVNTKISVNPFASMKDPIYQRNRQLSKYQVDEHAALRPQAMERVAAEQTIKTEAPRLIGLEKQRVKEDLQEAVISEQKALAEETRAWEADFQARTHAWELESQEERLESQAEGQRFANIIGLADWGRGMWETGQSPPLEHVFGQSQTRQAELGIQHEASRQNLLQDEGFARRATDYIQSGNQIGAYRMIDQINDPQIQAQMFERYANIFEPDSAVESFRLQY